MEALNRAIEDEEEALREYLEAQEKHRLAEQRKVIVSEFVGRRYLDEPDLDSKLQQENEVAEREMAAAFRKMTGLQERRRPPDPAPPIPAELEGQGD